MAFDTAQSLYLPRSVDDKREYAKLHGYTFLKDGIYDTSKPPVWGKIASLRKYMRQYPKIKWFWWIDLDTLIVDPYYALEDHILGGTRHPRFADKDIVISYDCNGFNAGSFMIRNSEWSREFLKELYNPIYDNRFGYQEQGTMQHLFETNPSVAEHFYIVPQRNFNAFPQFACRGERDHVFQEGDFLVHLAGCWAYGSEICEQTFEQYWNRRVQIIQDEL
ncbi:galactosyl transferase [Basidiobolus meristosporus CBS 931.73]|uniref:Galactosyl transferase n=1 Tax=Basidiobolus meristosporus CBS 931.73 TaxID=1314790 RepID=A0A1Y1XAT0_9FUNG|nr:galactosyl transferase [Basidiobolus meristosporus CBS 931.73]|eukprot:ORX82848.1 galactosyl transferase [Basidiobolus meristosporus CBS 931.73]